MRSDAFGRMPFFLGLLAGVSTMLVILAVVRVVQRRREREAALPEPPAGEVVRLQTQNEVFRREIVALRGEVERLRVEAIPTPVPTPPARPPEPPPPATVTPELEEEFSRLAEAGPMAMADSGYGSLMGRFQGAGAPAVAWLVDRLLHGATATERFLAAAFLEGIGDPAAIPSLAESLLMDRDELVRRMASHALAVIGTDASRAPLEAAMRDDADWGVRVNSAYGLAKMGDEQGAAELLVWYEESPEYRLSILGGLADAGHPSSAPLFRQIMAEERDMTYLLLAIHGATKVRDREAIPYLDRLIRGDHPQNVREAAEGARRAIQGE